MRHLIAALTIASLVGTALAAPAAAQSKSKKPSTPTKTTPAKPASPATPPKSATPAKPVESSSPAAIQQAPVAVAAFQTGSDEFRPTAVFNVPRAQTLRPGAVVVGIDGGTLAFDYGVSNDLEVGILAGLGLNRIGGNFDASVDLGAAAKYRFSNADNLSIAGLAGLGIDKADGSTTMQTTIFASLPVSFWIGSNGGFHVVPGISIGPDSTNQTTTTFGTGLAYEWKLNPTWRLMIADRLVFANNQVQNTYQGGLRIGVTPNTTVDLSLVNGFLNLGNPTSGAANVTLLNFSAYFGGTAAQVRQGFGI